MSQITLPIVAIVGRANVGKSSLFNRLLGERKAIVADEPGTTRDRVEAIVDWQGKSFWLVDTAGFERSGDDLKDSIHAQIDAAQEAADLIVIVLDSSSILSDEDQAVIKKVQKKNSNYIIALNKSDRSRPAIETDKLPSSNVISTSAIHGTGSGDLLDAIVDAVPEAASKRRSTTPTLALLGRPNVGKSSLINAIANQNRSIVSEHAGTTRDTTEIETYINDETWKVLDTAGLRRASKAKDIEYFSALRSSWAINQSDVCVLVIDATEPGTAQDQRIAGMIKEAGKGLVLAVNKWDKTERDDKARKQLEIRLERSLSFVWWAPMVLTIAPEKHHIHKLLELAQEVRRNRQRTVLTKDLNDTLQDAINQHPPAGLKNFHPKLNYITQTDIKPPTFTVFGSHTPYLHWSYKRFIESQVRESYSFEGTPLRFQWRSKHKAGEGS